MNASIIIFIAVTNFMIMKMIDKYHALCVPFHTLCPKPKPIRITSASI